MGKWYLIDLRFFSSHFNLNVWTKKFTTLPTKALKPATRHAETEVRFARRGCRPIQSSSAPKARANANINPLKNVALKKRPLIKLQWYYQILPKILVLSSNTLRPTEKVFSASIYRVYLKKSKWFEYPVFSDMWYKSECSVKNNWMHHDILGLQLELIIWIFHSSRRVGLFLAASQRSCCVSA